MLKEEKLTVRVACVVVSSPIVVEVFGITFVRLPRFEARVVHAPVVGTGIIVDDVMYETVTTGEFVSDKLIKPEVVLWYNADVR